MAIHWQVKFKSLRAGTDYTVNIYDGNYSGNPIPLKGGAEPFVTQEDDDEDMFLPVRTQSGYIRIVDDGKDANGNAFNWKDLLPSTDVDRPVTLTAATGTVLWHGFMQAQNFTGVLYGNPQEREFPVQCPLTVLSANDISATEREMKTFGYVIAQAFSSIPTLTFDNFIFQGGADAREWLLKLVDWQNYVTSEDDETVTARYDYGLILEDICKYWGWSCRVYRQSVIFSRVDDNDVEPNALVLTLSELESLTSNSGSVETFLSDASLPTDVFVSTDNDETLVRGYRKATVHSNIGDSNATILEAYPDAVIQQMEDGGSFYTVTYDDNIIVHYVGRLTQAASAFMEFSARSNYASFDYIQGTNSDENALSGPAIRILKSFSTTSASAYATIKTRFEHSFSIVGETSSNRFSGLLFHGKIASNGKEFKNEETNPRTYSMAMRIGIGKTRNGSDTMWFDGNRWSSTETVCNVVIGLQNNEFEFYFQTGFGDSWAGNKYARTGNRMGLLFVEFLGSNNMPEVQGERMFDIIDFKVELIYSSQTNKVTGADKGRNDRYDYEASSQGNQRNDWDSDLAYASAPDSSYMAFGFGVPVNSDGSRLGMATYGSSQEIPEQNMADRVAAYWGTSKRKITADLNTAVIPAITPRKTVTLDGTDCYPISITNDWWNDKTTLTLLQL